MPDITLGGGVLKATSLCITVYSGGGPFNSVGSSHITDSVDELTASTVGCPGSEGADVIITTI